jgi:lipopolysaccharide biosynthesis glycosyltransferase
MKIGRNGDQSGSPLCVLATGSDAAYFPGLLVTLESAFLHSERLRTGAVTVHVLDGGIPDRAWALLERRLHTLNPALNLVRNRLQFPDWQDAPRVWGGSLMAYARFWLPEFVEGDQVIYVDADILVQKDLGELFDRPFDPGVWTYACQDYSVRFLHNDCPWLQSEDLAVAKVPYFNSGLLKIDLAAWRRAEVASEAIRLVSEEPEKCVWWDQTVFNYLLRDHWKMLDQTWNLSIYQAYRYSDEAVLGANLHFLSGRKPWNTHSREFGFRYWRRFLRTRMETVPKWARKNPGYGKTYYAYGRSALLENSALARRALLVAYRVFRCCSERIGRRTAYAFEHWSTFDPVAQRKKEMEPRREKPLLRAAVHRWSAMTPRQGHYSKLLLDHEPK